ncbi:type II secretion system protein [Synechococcus sp. MU1617]|uniref:type II secretion system protein n=1 Tax=Synechococcus sp. MU1617 TaxID=2508346 RepID=UPI001CF84BF2|nr:type II secretion system protein [Synechococcus sp. MU1617]MCB4390211.1 type II secretion system protein [Synechococcus sp. MU1617]
MKSKSAGFSLLELLVGMVIITIGLSAAIPSYLRNMRQGEVDRFTQQLEAGFFGLRAKLGQQKTSCTLNFDQNGLNNFVPPSDVVEMKEHPERIECCNSDIAAAGQSSGCAYGPEIGTLLAEGSSGDEKTKIIRDRSLRLLDREGTPESEAVEVSVNLASYQLTPPGTSTMSDDLIFLIRSTNTQEQRLRTRCLQISGTGTIVRASWDASTSSCVK